MKLKSLFKGVDKPDRYQCPCCGVVYDKLPLCFGSNQPHFYFSVPADERAERIELKESLCVVDEKHFFHRGRLVIPIIDHEEDLVFNVWTSVSEDNFGIRMDLWNDPDRVNHEPYFGWLQTLVPTYGDTINIKAIVMENEVGSIPSVKIIENDHQLTRDQEQGISFKKALKIIDSIIKEAHQS